MFRRIQYRILFVKNLLPFANGIKRFFLLNVFIAAFSLALNFVTPVFYRMFIEEVILQRQIRIMIMVTIGYLSICVTNIMMGYLRNYNNNKILNRITFKMKFAFWRNLFKQDFSAYEKQDIGNVKMKIEDDINSSHAFANSQTIDYLFAYITIIVSVLLLFHIEWKLTLFSLIIFPLNFYFDNILSKREKKYVEIIRHVEQNTLSRLYNNIRGWREIKALNLQKDENLVFSRYFNEWGTNFAKYSVNASIRSHLLPLIRDDFFMQFGLYFIGGLLIIFNGLKIGDLLIFTMYYGMLSNAVRTVSTADANLQSNMPITDRLLKEIRCYQKFIPPYGVTPKDFFEIRFENVSFTYPESENEVLNNISFKITKGERVAITGRSGAGKTTILKLITGMITPTHGKVYFSGIDLQEANISEVHKHVGFVMQENLLFNLTILENLLYGKPNASISEITEACQKAYIYDFISNLPDGFDTVIGERGIKLSGGQRQRIVLARLFLRDVDVFIFDEATNALDQYSESIIQDTIRAITENKTIIVVAHRNSSLELCDRQIKLG